MRHKGSIGMVSVVGLASLSLLGLIGWGILVVQAGEQPRISKGCPSRKKLSLPESESDSNV